MFTILDSVADTAVATTRFACDLSACKGACCTTPGGRGAPLEDLEVDAVNEAIPVVLPYLSDRNREVIAREGGVEGSPGDYSTVCIDRRDCVFVYYEGEVAKCAIEKAYFDGKLSFRKPLSCHLFPIRVEELFGVTWLRYEKITECRPALANGRRLDVPLYRFLEEPLVRAFGRDYYDALVERIESRSATP